MIKKIKLKYEKMETTKFCDGIVLIRNAVNLEEQLKIIDIVERKGDLKDINGMWNFMGRRGRHFCNLNKYEMEDREFLTNIFNEVRDTTMKIDSTIPFTVTTHLLSLWYPSKAGIGWHVDGYGGNDGDEGTPVYSLTIGNSCIFSFRRLSEEGKQGVKEEVILNSGDIIIFGGPQRLMAHSVKKVIMGTFSHKEEFNARINLTFRTKIEFTEKDDEKYAAESYVNIYNERKMKNSF
jgi:hypothetical protein